MSILPASELLSTLQQNPQHRHSSPESLTYADRLASFTTWPHASPTPKELAKAGFIHLPTNKRPDNVRCRRCGDCLCNWKPEHDPRIQRHIHHYRCSTLWLVLATADRKKPSTKDIGFFDPSLQYDFPELCLFQDSHVFCNRIRRCKFDEMDLLELLPKCLRGEALEWFNQSNFRDLAVCLGALRSRFPQAPPKVPPEAPLEAPQAPPQAPPEAPLGAPQAPPQAPPEAPLGAPLEAPQAPPEAPLEAPPKAPQTPPQTPPEAPQTPLEAPARPSCRHCKKVFQSKNQLHRHLREECQKRVHRRSSSKSSSSPACSTTWPSSSSSAYSSKSSPQSSPTCSMACSPPPAYQAISPPPPPTYLTINDLFRMFGGRSTTTASSTITITIPIDDPFIRPFVSLKKSMGSTFAWKIGIGDRNKLSPKSAGAMCSSPQRYRTPSFNTGKRQTRPNLV